MRAGELSMPEKNNGFTLTELLVVMVIIGILVALVAPSVYQHIAPAKKTAAKSQIKSFMVALDNYYIDVGRFPSEKDGLSALWMNTANAKGWKGPYIKQTVPQDPWGYPYIYRAPGVNGPYDIISFGNDGKMGGDGEASDIYSWQSK